MTEREQARRAYFQLRQTIGCSDSGCPFRPLGGMRTNGGCRCHEEIEDAFARERSAAREQALEEALREFCDDDLDGHGVNARKRIRALKAVKP